MTSDRAGSGSSRPGPPGVNTVDAQVLAFVRTHGDERLLCAFNLSTEPATLALPAGDQVDAQSTLSFDPYGVRFARLTRV